MPPRARDLNGLKGEEVKKEEEKDKEVQTEEGYGRTDLFAQILIEVKRPEVKEKEERGKGSRAVRPVASMAPHETAAAPGPLLLLQVTKPDVA